MSERSPFFSICIPAYNCSALINEALASIKLQTFDDWEVIVYNDGSCDDTAAICMKQRLIPPSKYSYYSGENKGLLATRERLIKRATGQVIISLDADDMLLDPEALYSIHQAFVRHNCDLVLFNGTRNLETLEPFVDYSPICGGKDGLLDAKKVKECFSLDYRINNIALKAYRRELAPLLNDAPFLNMTEDRLQSLYVIQGSKKITLIDKPLYYYRPNPDSVTNRPFVSDYFFSQMLVEAEVDALARANGVAESKRKAFRDLILYGDLSTIRKTVSRKAARLSIYQQIRESSDYQKYYKSRRISYMRLDRYVALSLFAMRHFEVMDVFLTLPLFIKSITATR